jgi:hypothetical protein
MELTLNSCSYCVSGKFQIIIFDKENTLPLD